MRSGCGMSRWSKSSTRNNHNVALAKAGAYSSLINFGDVLWVPAKGGAEPEDDV